METNSVTVAMKKAYVDAPEILKPELERFYKRLEKTPEAIDPYLDFFGDLELMDVQSSMRKLYSLANGISQNYQEQLGEVIRQNNKFLRLTEAQEDEDHMAGIDSLALFLPIMAGSLLMIADMVGFIVFVPDMMLAG